jgi:hypothetical protein
MADRPALFAGNIVDELGEEPTRDARIVYVLLWRIVIDADSHDNAS